MKTVLTGVLVLFVGFWLVRAPESFATFAHNGVAWAWELTSTLFQSAIAFLNALFK